MQLFYIPPSGSIQDTPIDSPPVHLDNTRVSKLDWEPRTMEGVLTLVCPYRAIENELFKLKDRGTLLITPLECGDQKVFGPMHTSAIVFDQILLLKFHVKDLVRGIDSCEEISLEVAGRVSLAQLEEIPCENIES